MKLHKLHIVDDALCAIYHCNTIAGSDTRIGSGGIQIARTASSHHRNARQNNKSPVGFYIEQICAVTVNIGVIPFYQLSEMMLRDDVYRKMIFQYFNVCMPSRHFRQRPLYLETRIVFMMQYAVFAVSAFACKVESAVRRRIEMCSPFY